jgi:ABC-type Fe3+-hydroxamate transport system substrate-binding protein
MNTERTFTDMMKRAIDIPFPPKRIISIVPSQTELLYDLGLDEEVVGITKFCVHPKSWFKNKTKVGGTKRLNIEQIKMLKPDLILANKEENNQEEVEELAEHFTVWISDIKTIADGLEMILQIGTIVGKETESLRLMNDITNGFSALKKVAKPLSVAYFIWRNPWMTVGNDTFIHDVIEHLGWHNVYQDRTRYPNTSLEELKEKQTDLILLSSEPYPFKEKHIEEIQLQLPKTKIILIDGEMFSWYGSRMKLAAHYLLGLSQTDY